MGGGGVGGWFGVIGEVAGEEVVCWCLVHVSGTVKAHCVKCVLIYGYMCKCAYELVKAYWLKKKKRHSSVRRARFSDSYYLMETKIQLQIQMTSSRNMQCDTSPLQFPI